MRMDLKLFLIISFMCLFSNKTAYSEEKIFNYDQHKKQIIEKNFFKFIKKV